MELWRDLVISHSLLLYVYLHLIRYKLRKNGIQHLLLQANEHVINTSNGTRHKMVWLYSIMFDRHPTLFVFQIRFHRQRRTMLLMTSSPRYGEGFNRLVYTTWQNLVLGMIPRGRILFLEWYHVAESCSWNDTTWQSLFLEWYHVTESVLGMIRRDRICSWNDTTWQNMFLEWCDVTGSVLGMIRRGIIFLGLIRRGQI